LYFPRYWHLSSTEATNQENGEQWPLKVWGWDDHSEATAKQLAEKRLADALEALKRGIQPQGNSWYQYEDRPLREERIEEISGESGLSAVVTRAKSGPLILNTAAIMFVDIDLPEFYLQPSARGCLGLLFPGKKPDNPAQKPAHYTETLTKIEKAASLHAGFAARCYETPAGFRLLVTHKGYDPKSDESKEILQSFGTDPLFTRLCERQSCYRARLTAKPWRLKMKGAPASWPVPDKLIARHTKWLQSYAKACIRTGACRFLKTIGTSSEVCSEAQVIVKIHDGLACTGDKLA
jgi:hypothetical protein